MKRKQRRGISLIVLVITIIIMIILASAVVISLNRSGMKAKSKDAVEKFDNKQLQELVSLAWADAYAENVGKSTEELIPLLKESVENALTENNLNKEDYGIYVTEKGVEIAKGWLQTSAQTVVKGDTTLEIGDYINYSDTANNGSQKYTGKWGVLGAEDGKLLIMTEEETEEIINEILTEFEEPETPEEMMNMLITLNQKLTMFGNGKGAVGARLPKTEDVTRVVTDSMIETEDNLPIEFEDGTTYNLKNGDELTFYWDTTEVGVVCTEFPNGKTITYSSDAFEQFVWYDGSSIHIEKAPDTVPTEKQKICTLEFNARYNWLKENANILEKTYNFMFIMKNGYCNCDPGTHCSTIICRDTEAPLYVFDNNWYNVPELDMGMTSTIIIEDVLMPVGLFSFGGDIECNTNIRIVVELSQETKVIGSSTSGWNIV